MCSLKKERSKKTKTKTKTQQKGWNLLEWKKKEKEGGFCWLNCFSKWQKVCGNKYHARIGLLPGMKITRLLKRRDLAMNLPPLKWSLGLIEEDSWSSMCVGTEKKWFRVYGLGFNV